MESVLLDAAGHRRAPATMPGYHRGRPPRNNGEVYPADPPTVEEIVAVMRSIGDGVEGHRLGALTVLLWACWPADQRSAITARRRPGSLPRRGTRSPREGRVATRGRYGVLGVGAA